MNCKDDDKIYTYNNMYTPDGQNDDGFPPSHPAV